MSPERARRQPSPEEQNLREFNQAAEYWQDQLRLHKGTDQYYTVVRQTIEDLDSLWPYHNKIIYFDGPGLAPRQRTDEEEDNDGLPDSELVHITKDALSDGFDVRMVKLPENDEPEPMIVHSAMVGMEVYMPDGFTRDIRIKFCFPLLKSAILLPEATYILRDAFELTPVNSKEVEPGKIVASLQRRSKQLDARIKNPEFLALPLADQLAELDKSVKAVDKYLPLESELELSANRAVLLNPLTNELTKLDIEGRRLRGVSLGAVYLGRVGLENSVVVNINNPVLDRGLCLALDPSKRDRAAYPMIRNDQSLLIPVSRNNLQLDFLED